MKHILDFIYYGEVDIPITELASFMKTAKFLQVLSLKNCVSQKNCFNNNSCETSASDSGTVSGANFVENEVGTLGLCKKENHMSSHCEMFDSKTVCDDADEKAVSISNSSSVKLSDMEADFSIPNKSVAGKNLMDGDKENSVDDFTPISLGPVRPVFVNVEKLDDRRDMHSDSRCLNPLEEYTLICDVMDSGIVKVEEFSEGSEMEETTTTPPTRSKSSEARNGSWELLAISDKERGDRKCEEEEEDHSSNTLHRHGNQRSNQLERIATVAAFQKNMDVKRISGANIIASPNSSCAAAKRLAEDSVLEDWTGGSDCESMKREILNLKNRLRQRDDSLAQMMNASFAQIRELMEVVHKDLKENLSKLDQKIELVNEDLGGKVSSVARLLSQATPAPPPCSSSSSSSSVSVPPSSVSSDSLGETVDIGQGITCSKLLYDMLWVCTEKADWARTLLRGVFGPLAARMRVAPRKEGNKSFSKDFLLVSKALFRTWYMRIHTEEVGACADVEVQVDSLPAYLSDRAAEMDGPRGLQRKLKAASPAEKEAIRTLHREHLAKRRKEKEMVMMKRRKKEEEEARWERQNNDNSAVAATQEEVAMVQTGDSLLAADQFAVLLEPEPMFQH